MLRSQHAMIQILTELSYIRFAHLIFTSCIVAPYFFDTDTYISGFRSFAWRHLLHGINDAAKTLPACN